VAAHLVAGGHVVAHELLVQVFALHGRGGRGQGGIAAPQSAHDVFAVQDQGVVLEFVEGADVLRLVLIVVDGGLIGPTRRRGSGSDADAGLVGHIRGALQGVDAKLVFLAHVHIQADHSIFTSVGVVALARNGIGNAIEGGG